MANKEPITITSSTIAGYETVDARMSINVYAKDDVELTTDELTALEKTQFEYIKDVLERDYAGIPVETKLSTVDIPSKYRLERAVIHCAKDNPTLDESSRKLAVERSSVINAFFHDEMFRNLIERGTFFYVPESGKFQVKRGATFDDLSPYSARQISHHSLKKYILSQKGYPITEDNAESSFPYIEKLKRRNKDSDK